jgi:aminopeptidase N
VLRRASAVALATTLIATGVTLAANRPAGRDPFFPGSGSPAYDVSHYDISLSYRPPARDGARSRIAARTAIRVHAKKALRRLELDLAGLRVRRVEVNGARARSKRRRDKLITTLPSKVPAGADFVAVVSYRGRPRTLTDPDRSKEGWIELPQGGSVALGEPVGTAAWLPCNNSLTDKASFAFHLDAPARRHGRRLVAVANGRLVGRRRHGGRIRWSWAEAQPMAPYLATVAFADFRLRSVEIDGIPSWTAVDADLYRDKGGLIRRGIRSLGEIVRFERRLYGRYPFDALGTTVTDGGEYALETQTRPTYPSPPRRNLLVHELAHQWVGDSTGLRSWPDIWLNEGFATFTEWIYRERHGGPSARSVFAELRRRPAADPFWSPPPGHPGGPKNLFDGAVYVRGAMTLEALRIRIGDRAFFRLLHAWTAGHRYGNVSTPEFIAFVGQRSARPGAGRLLRRWLFRPGKP